MYVLFSDCRRAGDACLTLFVATSSLNGGGGTLEAEAGIVDEVGVQNVKLYPTNTDSKQSI
jgi:hypothetical protein